MCSTGDKSGAAGGSSNPPPSSSINTQVHTITQKGKKKPFVAQKKTSEDSSMRIAVPDKNSNKWAFIIFYQLNPGVLDFFINFEIALLG